MVRWVQVAALVLLVGCVLFVGVAVKKGVTSFEGWLEGPAFSGTIPEVPQPSARVPSYEASPLLAEPREALPAKGETEVRELPPVSVERAETPALSKTLNVLLVGIDQRPGQKYAGRPDTIVVAALSQHDRHLGLISIPRDLYVEIPGHGMDRINASFSVAQSRKESSLALLERVVTDTLRLPIRHTIALNLGGFERVIDSLGGVEVNVPCPILDNFVDSRTENGRRPLRVGAGLQHLDGINAGLYVRSRHGRSDWSRARRQQAVLFAIKRRFAEIDGLLRLPDFLDELSPLITSDMTRAELIRLVRASASIRPENIHGLVLGIKQAAPHFTEDGKAVLLPDFEEIDRSLAQLFSADLPGKHPELAPCPKADVALTRRSL